VIKRSVHGDLSIFLTRNIIPFRLIEHQVGRIVNRRKQRGKPHEVGSPAEAKESEMSILSIIGLPSIGYLASRYSLARSRHRTELAIRALPLELQKDIGWPEPDDTRFASEAQARDRDVTSHSRHAPPQPRLQ
jgi:hypothetical protein